MNLLQMQSFNHRCEITYGLLQKECATILQGFFRKRREGSAGEFCSLGQKKAGLELLQASRSTSHSPPRFSSGSNANQLRPLRRVTILTKIHSIYIVATAQLGSPVARKFS